MISMLEQYDVKFLDGASEELDEVYAFRESWELGSGDAFLTAVDKAIDSILDMPNSWKKYPGWELAPIVSYRLSI